MHIIFDEVAKSELSDKHVVLELDTISTNGRMVTAYCVVEHIPFQDLGRIGELYDRHQDMIGRYKAGEWDSALECLYGLLGQWGGRVDSFYEIMKSRLQTFQAEEPGPNWSPVLTKD